MIEYEIPFVCLIFTSLISIIFFSRKKVELQENYYYKNILIFTLFVNITNFISHYMASIYAKNEISEWFSIIFANINKLGSLFIVIITTNLLSYMLYITFDKYRKNFCKIKKINYIFYFLIGILIFLFGFEVYKVGQVTSGRGTSVVLTFAIVFFDLIASFIIALFNIKKFDKRYYAIYIIIPLILILGLFVMLHPEFNIYDLILCLLCYLMYFTIENPDVRMLSQLEFARDQAEKANNAKTEFLSSMSHEIRTPLNAIVGFSECIVNSDDIVSARSDARDIIMASQNLLEIVNGILDISKIEANKMEIIETDYDIEPILKNLTKLMIPRIGEKPIEFKTNFALDLPGILHGDSGKLKQIITNILTNAVKYTEKGRIDFNVNCINEKDVCSLVISVEDTGRGIKSEKINKLFNKFERLDEDKNTTIEGTGLGLAITKKLTEMMGGKIIVQSKYGVGSKFTVYLKQKIVCMDKKYSDTKDEISENIDFSGKKVLVVDDNKMNLKVATRILKTYNISVCESESGIECVERIKANEKYDLILLDDMMPRLSGTETLEKLNELNNFDIPVVALTANALEGMKEKYLKEGFNDYLSKPFNKIELENVLKKYLNTKVYNDINMPKIQDNIVEKDENLYNFSDKKILIVDDNKLNIKVAEIMLKKYNAQIQSVLSGFECLEKVKNNTYDLIFMDYMMPQMDGIETLHKLKELDDFNTPVVSLTADAVEGSKEKFLKEGFNEYISKPIDKVQLERIVLKYLSN